MKNREEREIYVNKRKNINTNNKRKNIFVYTCVKKNIKLIDEYMGMKKSTTHKLPYPTINRVVVPVTFNRTIAVVNFLTGSEFSTNYVQRKEVY